MNLVYNDGEKNKNDYVTKNTFVITIIIFIIMLIITAISLVIYFNNKLQKTVESLEIKDDITLIQNEDENEMGNVTIE